ncbi:MAG TPA: hypothetical protein PLY88_07250 [Candidatus Omnitrophota bacterium]|nr:hypothetical protein [Candidatus Omnitrophota bacterium]HRK62323.1 hypothetical protein [Candidatus Omnitrophota bacterium]
MIQKLALIVSITLPLWNIPLIVRMIQRKSSDDVSVAWAVGVWASFALMAPQGFVSEDLVWRTFSIVNLIMFSFVTATVLFYRLKKPKQAKDSL